MGDHNAVDLAQEMHFNVLSQAGQLQPQHLITYPAPLQINSDGYFEGVMIDDRVGLQLHRDSFWSHLNRDLKNGDTDEGQVLETYLPADYPRPVAGEGTKLRDEVAFEASEFALLRLGGVLTVHRFGDLKWKGGMDWQGRRGISSLRYLSFFWSLHVSVSARAKCWMW